MILYSRIGLGLVVLAMAFAGSLATGGELLTTAHSPAAAPPPAQWVIEEATARGEASDEVATLEIEVQVRVFATDWVRIPLLPAKTPIASARITGDQEEAFLQRWEDGCNLIARGPERFTVEITVYSQVTGRGGARSVHIPLVPALANSTRIVLPTENVDYRTTPAMEASKEALEGGETAIRLYGAPGGGVDLHWSPKPRLKDLTPLVFADHDARATVGRGAIRAESRIRYSVLQGTVDTLQLDLPEGVNLLQVGGDGIRRWDTGDAQTEGGRLQIQLAEPIDGHFDLHLVTETPLGKLPAEQALPLPRARGVEREKGRISIVAGKGIRVEAGDSSGVTQIDATELAAARARPSARLTWGTGQAEERSHPRAAPDLAFRFLQRPVSLGLRIAQVEPKVSAEVFNQVTASRESLRTVSTIVYAIRDAGVFRFRVRVPDRVKLLDVRCPTLNTWEITDGVLTVELRSKAEGAFKLVVESEQPLADAQEEPVTLDPLKLLDVERETGYVAVGVRSGTRVELAAPSAGGASQIDVGELPSALTREAEPELGFRTIRHPYRIQLIVGAVQPEIHITNHGRLTIDERELRLESRLQVDVRKSGIFELRLTFPQELRLAEDIRGPAIEDWRLDEAAEELVISFQRKVSGNLQLQIRAERTLEDAIGAIPFPRVVGIDVKKETGFLVLGSPLAIRMAAPPEAYTGLNPVAPSELPDDLVSGNGIDAALAFKFLKADWALTVQTEAIEPVVTATVTSRVELSSTLETTLARVDYEVRHAGQDTFYLRLPAGADSVSIEGSGIKDRGPIDHLPPKEGADRTQDRTAADGAPDPGAGMRVARAGNRPLWRVIFQKRVKGTVRLFVSFERSLEKTGTITYEGLEAVRVQREEGYVSLAARTNVEVAPPRVEGAYRIDVRQIPEWRAMAGDTPAIWAFQYMAHPYKLVIDVTKHEDAEVITAVAEVAMFETVVGRDGQATTDLFLIMRNNNQQNLELQLPEGATIWGAKVNAREVSLAQKSTPGEAGQTILIPIVGASLDGKPFQVTLRYEEQLGALDQWSTLRLEAPVVSIPVMRCLWELYVPPEHHLVKIGGNMSRLTGRESSVYEVYRRSRRELEEIRRTQQQPETQAVRQQGRQQGKSSSRSLDIGAPPTSGKAIYRFEKTMALEAGRRATQRTGPPVTVRATLMRFGFLRVLQVLFVLGFLAGIVALFLIWDIRRRALLFGGLTLLFFIVDTLSESWHPDLVLTWFLMSLLGLVACGGAALLSALRSGWQILNQWRAHRRTVALAPSPAAAAAGETAPANDAQLQTPAASEPETPHTSPNEASTQDAPADPAGAPRAEELSAEEGKTDSDGDDAQKEERS